MQARAMNDILDRVCCRVSQHTVPRIGVLHDRSDINTSLLDKVRTAPS
jgi:hypothetical protein